MKKDDFCHDSRYIPLPSPVKLGCVPCWAGHQRTSDRRYFWNGMKRGSRELLLWQYTVSGCGMVELDGKKYPVNPGEAFLLTIPEKHLYYLSETPGEWEFLYLAVEGDEAMRIVRQLRQIRPPVSTAYASPETVKLAWELIGRAVENDFSTAVEASKLAYSFMMSLICGSTASGNSSGNDLLHKLHQFCISRISEDLSVEDMAVFSGYSRSHFCRIFRELSGKTPHGYLLELRMRMAARMLLNGTSVKETAALCGFTETGYFCKVFRRFTGTAPAAFRRKG